MNYKIHYGINLFSFNTSYKWYFLRFLLGFQPGCFYIIIPWRTFLINIYIFSVKLWAGSHTVSHICCHKNLIDCKLSFPVLQLFLVIFTHFNPFPLQCNGYCNKLSALIKTNYIISYQNYYTNFSKEIYFERKLQKCYIIT